MKKLFAVTLSCFFLMVFSFDLHAAKTTTVHDKSGKKIGTATTSGNKTTYRNKSGKQVGTATRSGKTTTYRDNKGRVVGKKTHTRK